VSNDGNFADVSSHAQVTEFHLRIQFRLEVPFCFGRIRFLICNSRDSIFRCLSISHQKPVNHCRSCFNSIDCHINFCNSSTQLPKLFSLRLNFRLKRKNLSVLSVDGNFIENCYKARHLDSTNPENRGYYKSQTLFVEILMIKSTHLSKF
jgi:hypothetical protein